MKSQNFKKQSLAVRHADASDDYLEDFVKCILVPDDK